MTAATSFDSSVDRHWIDYLALLSELVRQPSTLGNESAAQAILFRHLRRMGLNAASYDLDLAKISRNPQFAPTGWSYEGRPNVTATLPGRGGGRTLVLNGHIDVVSPEPASWWTYDPWGATVAGNRMYGRGALDMKGGLVAALLAIHAVMDAGISLRGDLQFESVIEEECTGNGMAAARARSAKAHGTVVMELTGLQAWIATPGVVWFELTVRGKPAYVGATGAYVNAIEQAAALLARLKPALLAELRSVPPHPAYDLPFALSAGTIAGGDWPTNVPLECRMTCRMSYPLDWSFEQVRVVIERNVLMAAAGDPWLAANPPSVRYPGFRAVDWSTNPDSELIRSLEDCHGEALGQLLTRAAFPGTADARYFDGAGGEQAVYYGPRGGNQHAPDEFVELDSIRDTARVLARLIAKWCG